MTIQLRAVLVAIGCLLCGVSSGVFAAGSDAADGQKVVDESCSSCHAAGLMGAPKIGDTAAWQARFNNAGSIGELLASTQRGKGNMPPRGGEAGLTDTELQSAIQYMLGKSGIAATASSR